MSLIEKYLPRYQFCERHALDIAATPAAVMAAILAYQPASDPFFRRMIALREWPMRTLNRLRRHDQQVAPFGIQNFTLLEQQAEQAVIFGLVGQFWKLDYGQATIADGRAFLSYAQPGSAKLVLAFALESQDAAHTRLSTETRVSCLDAAAQRRFTPYWYLIRPVSGLIRRRILAGIQRQALELGTR